MRAEAGARRRAREGRRVHTGRSRAPLVRRAAKWALLSGGGALAGLIAAGVLFAGSEDRIPAGVSVLGVKLSGLTPAEAEAKLEGHAATLAGVPVVFTAAGERFEILPRRLDVRVDWAAVVAEAKAAGEGPLPIRGLKRLGLRLFGSEIEPHATAYEAAVDFELAQIARSVNAPAREAAVALDGLTPRIVPAETGRRLDHEAARAIVVGALARFERRPVPLPIEVERPKVTAAMLAPVAEQLRTVLSAPVRLGYADTHWEIEPSRLAGFLVLPSGGSREPRVGGPSVQSYFRELAVAFDRKPRSARFRVLPDGSVKVVPGIDGRELDPEGTGRALLAAALRPQGRDADLAVRTTEPARTTEEARAMGIKTTMASYSTLYAGTADRIRNLQLAITFIHGTLVGPGEEFSLNRAVGPRTLQRGFRIAPVIIGGEYEEDVGGGVSQVATTVFNAAWEAGLKITERNPHALYISRYPDGRDATVNYPDLDLRFRNDTKGWILVRGSYDEAGIAVTLLGPKTGRRIVSEPGPLRVVGPPRLEKVLDPTLLKGQRKVEDEGEPARAIVVKRTVYEGESVLYEEYWSTRYRAEPKVVRVGTKPRPAPPKEEEEVEAPPSEAPPPAETFPPAAETQPASTEPAATTP